MDLIIPVFLGALGLLAVDSSPLADIGPAPDRPAKGKAKAKAKAKGDG